MAKTSTSPSQMKKLKKTQFGTQHFCYIKKANISKLLMRVKNQLRCQCLLRLRKSSCVIRVMRWGILIPIRHIGDSASATHAEEGSTILNGITTASNAEMTTAIDAILLVKSSFSILSHLFQINKQTWSMIGWNLEADRKMRLWQAKSIRVRLMKSMIS